MSAEFVLRSVTDGTVLEWRGTVGEKEFFEVTVSLRGRAVSATDRVYDMNARAWTSFFESLARDWRGWEGARERRSLEGQLNIACTSDRLGHVSVRVELRGDMGRSDWLAADTIFLEAGQLAEVAARARAYFGAPALRQERDA